MVKMMNLLVPMMTLCLSLSTISRSQIDDITCNEALPLLTPCQPYLVGSAEVSSTCCEGVNTIFQRANTTQVRRDVCKCIKNAASQIGVNPEKAKQLPQLCNITLPFPIDPSIDCNTSQTDDSVCKEALPLFTPCQPYLVGSAEISASCCAGLTGIIQLGDTTQFRRDLCKCIKNAASQIGVNPQKAKQLPQLCKITLPFPIDPSVDCNT
ncbi:non-specific lipid-transfer protein 1-like [Abrus precatorius]|uniref:Non-specific lipid-transfer protein n=1 Tax=Abrus precatorius TaxID=3816 RepID=A0A8B8KCF0_ABRPR|nr:non-specific lipid-transfer protein 1-like [Abrus precatorius]